MYGVPFMHVLHGAKGLARVLAVLGTIVAEP
jgi:hypothetical protein